MCKIVLFPTEEENGTVKLIMSGSQIRPFIKEVANLNLKFEQNYDYENLAFEILHKAWGRKIAKEYSFCKVKIFFNGNDKNHEKKTIVILKVMLPNFTFDLTEDCSLISLDKATIDKIILEGKIEDGSRFGKKVRIDEIHQKFIKTCFEL